MATIAARKTRTSLKAERIFYLSMMAALLVLVAWGFARSFFLRSVLTPPGTYLDRPDWMRWAFMVHGTLFTCWLALFATQTVLIGSKRLPLHKQVGRTSYPLLYGIVGYGLFVGWFGARYGFHDVPFDSVTFSALPWLVILAFGALAWSGLEERRDPQRHKRLMLLSAIALADAGIARITMFQGILPPWFDVTVFMLIPLVLWDLATLHRVHRTTIKGGLVVAAALLLSVPIGMSPPWHALVTGVMGVQPVPAGHTVS
ncbi:MAG TPA: hypothetical protein VIV07_10795 [Sphingomicrobium sp.]